MAGILRKIFRFLLLQGKTPRFCKVDGHHDGAADGLQRTDEGLRRPSGGVDIVYHQHPAATQAVYIERHETLDVRRKLILTGDVGTLPAAADAHEVEAVDGASQTTQQGTESLPPPHVGSASTRRNADDDDVRQILETQRARHLSGRPAAIHVTTILESENPTAEVALFKRRSPEPTSGNVAV